METFNVGDKVKFLNEVGSGTVVEIIDANMVMVESSDGFHIPFMTRELIHQGSGFKENEKLIEKKIDSKVLDERDDNLVKEISSLREKGLEIDNEIYFAIVSMADEESNVLNAYLLNVSAYNILFHLAIKTTDGLNSWQHDDLLSEEKIFLGKLPVFNDLEELKIVCQLIFYKPDNYMPVEPVNATISLSRNIIESASSFLDSEYFEEKAILLPILNQNLIEHQYLAKEPVIKDVLKPDNIREKKEVPVNLEEVDLHAEEIVENINDYSPFEIVEMQMSRFEFALETAIRNKQKRIVFIHGAGGGKLKHKIRKLLDEKYPRLKYQDASFKEYGYGATLVILYR